MKVAEALVERSELRRRLDEYKGRMSLSSVAVDGEAPDESPETLAVEFSSAADRLEYLIGRINITNTRTVLPAYNLSVTEALARRDVLAIRHDARETVVGAAQRRRRFGREEIVYKSTVDIAAIRREMGEYARERRKLDTAIQQSNWNTDLLE